MFLARLKLACKISYLSSVYFANIRTALVSLIVLPFIEIVYNLALGVGLSSDVLFYSLFASIVMSAYLSQLSGVVASVAADRIRQCFVTIELLGKLDVVYWIAKGIVSCCISLVTSLIFLLAAYLLCAMSGVPELHFVPYMLRALFALGIALISASFVGIALSAFSIYMSDPYMGSTLASAILPISSGVIVPISYLGNAAQVLCSVLPATHVIQFIQTGDAWQLVLELIVAGVWLCLGLVSISVSLFRLRSGRPTNLL